MSIEKEPEGKYIKARDLKLHYHEFGRGYPVICIHGAGPGASAWSNFKGIFEEFAKYYRTILFARFVLHNRSLGKAVRVEGRLY